MSLRSSQLVGRLSGQVSFSLLRLHVHSCFIRPDRLDQDPCNAKLITFNRVGFERCAIGCVEVWNFSLFCVWLFLCWKRWKVNVYLLEAQYSLLRAVLMFWHFPLLLFLVCSSEGVTVNPAHSTEGCGYCSASALQIQVKLPWKEILKYQTFLSPSLPFIPSPLPWFSSFFNLFPSCLSWLLYSLPPSRLHPYLFPFLLPPVLKSPPYLIYKPT